MSDKDGTVVVLNSTDYQQYMTTMLQDSDVYTKIPKDPISLFQTQLIRLLQEGLHLNIISQKEIDYIINENPQTPILHGLPKVHKLPPAMRPIISGIDSFS